MKDRRGATERAVRRYRRLLTLYPRAYREVAAEELCQVFREEYEDETRSRGWMASWGLWLRAGVDTVRTAPGAWRRELRAQRVARAVTGTGWGRGDNVFQDLSSDARYAGRGLMKTPSFTAVAVAILGLGIGATTSIFAVLDAVYFDELPHVVEPDRLVRLYRTTASTQSGALAYPDYEHYRDNAAVFDGLMAYDPAGIALTISRNDGRVDGRGTFVSDNYFDVLGTRPAAGRWFLPEEDRSGGSHRVAIISHGVWNDMFDGDPSAVGASVRLNGKAFTVVGVAPEGFRGPSPLETPPDVWFPFHAQPLLAPAEGAWPLERVEGNRWVWIWSMGRLRNGITLEAAQDNVEAMASHLEETFAFWNKGWGARVYENVKFHPPSGTSLATMTRLLLAVVVAVLLVASANIAILLLARGSARSRDVAVRVAMGAGRGRVIRGALTESLILGLLGAAAGVGVAYLSADVVAGVLPTSFSVSFEPDLTVLAFAVGLALVTAMTFGLIPALQTASVDVNRTMKGDERGAARSRVRGGLVVAQVAVSVSLAISAALMARSLATASAVPLGYDVEDRMLLSVNLNNHGYSDAEGLVFARRTLERLQAVPGVRSATTMVMIPFRGSWGTSVPGPGERTEENLVDMGLNAVSPGFFRTMGIRILAGRPTDERDVEGATPALVVSASTARLLWPNQDPLGQQILEDDGTLRWEVVGVAEDTRFNDLGAAPDAYAYMAHEQRYQPSVTFVVEGAVAVGPLREAVLSVNPGMAIARVQSVKDAVNRELARFRTSALLVGVFGSLALVLAMVGLYGVLSYSVVRSRRDIGIRVALGASTRRVGRGVLARALRLTITGLAVGGVLTFAGARLLASFLYGIGPSDPLTWAGAAVVVLLVAGVASVIPAARAAKVDPMLALRAE
jgi:putative ABC transport system permease protein